MTMSVDAVNAAKSAGYFLDIFEYPSQLKVEINIGSGYDIEDNVRNLVVSLDNDLIRLETSNGKLISIRDVTAQRTSDEWSHMQKIVTLFVETLKTELSIDDSFCKIENKEN